MKMVIERTDVSTPRCPKQLEYAELDTANDEDWCHLLASILQLDCNMTLEIRAQE